MIPDFLLQQTLLRFPEFQQESITATLIEKGGSDRKFYRLHIGPRKTQILVHYGHLREENRHYVEVANFLKSQSLHVPEIHHHDPNQGLIWMQDLGEQDLWSIRHEPASIRLPHYERVLEQIALLHQVPVSRAGNLTLPLPFDSALYRWEQNYFFDHCLTRHFGLKVDLADFPALADIADQLAELPRVLLHRDFQSQNILIHSQATWMIDFQGMRLGLPHYDLASLLYDPYVDFDPAERSQLLSFYQNTIANDEPDFEHVFRLCALQRLMQALGAYGFLGHTQNKPDFLRHIPAALASLRKVADTIPSLGALHPLLNRISD